MTRDRYLSNKIRHRIDLAPSKFGIFGGDLISKRSKNFCEIYLAYRALPVSLNWPVINIFSSYCTRLPEIQSTKTRNEKSVKFTH